MCFVDEMLTNVRILNISEFLRVCSITILYMHFTPNQINITLFRRNKEIHINKNYLGAFHVISRGGSGF